MYYTHLLFIFVLLLFNPIYSRTTVTLSFNSSLSSDCTITNPCSLSNESIWIPNAIPSNRNTIIISSSSFSSSVPVFYIDQTLDIFFHSITLENAILISYLPVLSSYNLILKGNSMVNVSTINLLDNFTLGENSSLNVVDDFEANWCNLSGILNTNNNTTLFCANTTLSNEHNFISYFRSIQVSVHQFSNVTFNNGLSGNLNVRRNSTVSISSSYRGIVEIAENANVILINLDENSIMKGYTGDGFLIIDSPNVYMTGDWAGNNLIFYGKVNITMENVVYYGSPWFGDDKIDQPSQITVYVFKSDFAPTAYFGDFYFYDQFFFNGTVFGTITFTDCEIHLYQNIQTSADYIYFINSTIEYFTLPYDGNGFPPLSLNATSIFIDENSSLFSHRNYISLNVGGDLINSGLIILNINTDISVYGNLIQKPSGILQFEYYHAQTIYVYDSVYLDGTMDFTCVGGYYPFIIYTELAIIKTLGEITGHFYNETILYSSKNHGLKLHYNSHSVTLVYSKLYWLWVGLALAIISVVFLIIFVHRKKILEKIRPRLQSYGIMV